MYLYQTSVALATNTEAYCSCNSMLYYATYDKIDTTCTNKTIPNSPFSHWWSNNIMPGILCLKFPFYLMHSQSCHSSAHIYINQALHMQWYNYIASQWLFYKMYQSTRLLPCIDHAIQQASCNIYDPYLL